jgi:hypothetical protein
MIISLIEPVKVAVCIITTALDRNELLTEATIKLGASVGPKRSCFSIVSLDMKTMVKLQVGYVDIQVVEAGEAGSTRESVIKSRFVAEVNFMESHVVGHFVEFPHLLISESFVAAWVDSAPIYWNCWFKRC